MQWQFTNGKRVCHKATSESDTATLFLATPYTSSSAYKCAIIAQGLSNYSKSKLHFCFNSINDNAYPTQNATLSDSKVSIDYNGNVSVSNNLTVNSTINCATAFINGDCTALKYYCAGKTILILLIGMVQVLPVGLFI